MPSLSDRENVDVFVEEMKETGGESNVLSEQVNEKQGLTDEEQGKIFVLELNVRAFSLI